MKTDIEKFKELCADFGLAPTESIADGKYNTIEGETCLTFETPQPKVVGYASSLASFDFNPDGSFKCVGVWE